MKGQKYDDVNNYSLIHHLHFESAYDQSQPSSHGRIKEQRLWMEEEAIHQSEGNVTLIRFADRRRELSQMKCSVL